MPTNKVKQITAVVIRNDLPATIEIAEASDTTSLTRRDRAATIERTDKYANIDAGPLPFKYSIGYSGAEMDARDTIILCQKAYFNVGIVRNIIDLMTEFSVGEIYFREGNKASRDFFAALFTKIGLRSFMDRWFREYYRSGNVFTFRFDGKLKPGDVRKIVQIYGLPAAKAFTEIEVDKMQVPARYVILNPADILFAGNISFYTGIYFKRLSDYELMRLRAPKTDEDKEVLNSLPPDIKQQIYKRNIGVVNLPLNPLHVTAVFYKKQDYEPFSAPMIWPVLEDINFKIEMKRLDMAIARTQQQVILLVTTGTEPEKGGINQNNILALQKLFQNESVGRVLVADYTTKAEFVVPNIGSILTPAKYEQLDKDINIGLNNILVGGEKFANQSTKVDVFLARLRHGRDLFLNDFLIPEIRRIAKSVGFKSYPIPYFDEIVLKNDNLKERLFVRLAELGLLAPNEIVTALESGRLPDQDTSMENQKSYKQARDKGYYEPLIGGGKGDGEGMGGGSGGSNSGAGRPGADGVPQMTKKMSPIGASEKFSVTSLMTVMKATRELEARVQDLLKLKFKKKKLNEEQLAVATAITKIIVTNEDQSNWGEKIKQYCDKPVDTNEERVKEILDIAATYGTDDYSAALLYHSKIPDKKE